jgi:hypothetical protein
MLSNQNPKLEVNRPTEDVVAEKERMARVVELRSEGWTFTKIGKELGVSQQWASMLYKKSLALIPAEAVTTHRTRQLEMLATLREKALEVMNDEHFAVSHGRIMIDPDTNKPLRDSAPVIAAITTLLRIEEREARLLGLDSPVRQEITVDAVTYHVVGVPTELLGDIAKVIDVEPIDTDDGNPG